MRMIKVFFFLASCTMVFGCNRSKEVVVQLDGECVPVIGKFFGTIQAGNHNEALNYLLQSNSKINPTDSATIDLKVKFKNINERSGKYLGYKIVKKRGIESDIAVYSCLVKYQKQFYRYVFMFYKADGNAKIYKFLFDDEMDDELEESLKLYL